MSDEINKKISGKKIFQICFFLYHFFQKHHNNFLKKIYKSNNNAPNKNKGIKGWLSLKKLVVFNKSQSASHSGLFIKKFSFFAILTE